MFLALKQIDFIIDERLEQNPLIYEASKKAILKVKLTNSIKQHKQLHINNKTININNRIGEIVQRAITRTSLADQWI